MHTWIVFCLKILIQNQPLKVLFNNRDAIYKSKYALFARETHDFIHRQELEYQRMIQDDDLLR